MMCQSIGLPPISIIGLGRTAVSSLSREPNPPARITTFTRSRLLNRLGGAHASGARGAEPRRAWPSAADRSNASALAHVYDVGDSCCVGIVALRFGDDAELVGDRSREPEAVARAIAARAVAAHDVELDPRAAPRARLEHEQLAGRGHGPAEQPPAEVDPPPHARALRRDRQAQR